jgi:hypothetical protein
LRADVGLDLLEGEFPDEAIAWLADREEHAIGYRVCGQSVLRSARTVLGEVWREERDHAYALRPQSMRQDLRKAGLSMFGSVEGGVGVGAVVADLSGS